MDQNEEFWIALIYLCVIRKSLKKLTLKFPSLCHQENLTSLGYPLNREKKTNKNKHKIKRRILSSANQLLNSSKVKDIIQPKKIACLPPG